MENNYEKYKQNLGTAWIIDETDEIEFYEYPLNPIYWISKCGKVYNAESYFYPAVSKIKNGKGFEYYTVNIVKKRTRVHRMLAITFLNNPNNYETVDHISRCTLDNSLENLRWATHSMNSRNKTKSKNKTSKYIGVSKSASKYVANINLKDCKKYLGRFATEIEAAEAYNTEAIKHNILHLNKINKNDNE